MRHFVVVIASLVVMDHSLAFRDVDRRGPPRILHSLPSKMAGMTGQPLRNEKPLSSAGLLPVIQIDNRWCALLYNATAGPKASVLTDFGGKREFIEPSGAIAPPPPPSGIRPPTQTLEAPNSCAARELYEESGALWGLGELLNPPLKPRPRAPPPVYTKASNAKGGTKKQESQQTQLQEPITPSSIRALEDPLEGLLQVCNEARRRYTQLPDI